MLDLIRKKVLSGRRLDAKDAVGLFRSEDIFAIGRLASIVAEKKNGGNAYFVVNRHINPTNICVNRCRFCAFSCSQGDSNAYEMTIDEIIGKLKKGQGSGVKGQGRKRPDHASSITNNDFTEVHIVGGLHPDWPFKHYLRMLSEIKREFPSIHIKAFTAVEIDHFSRISGLTMGTVLERLKDKGLDAMPGGGAEIFAERVRNKLCPEKISGKRWLEIHRAAHMAGIRTNATMLYGHIEDFRERVDHLMKLRSLQDETNGFQAFIPLAYHPKNTDIGGFYSSGIDDLKTIAVSRLVLDNFDHIKAYWIMLGEKIAQLSLLFGADDLDGTIIEEKITHAAGAMSSEGMTKSEMIHLIEKAGKTAVERDAFYNVLPVS